MIKCLLALSLVIGATPAAIPSAAAQAASAETPTVIPFKPPLDTVLRFQVNTTQVAAGKRSWSTSAVEELRFVRNGEGYILYWQVDPNSLTRVVTTGEEDKPAPRDEPIAFDLGANGALLRVRDWDRVRERLAKPPAGAPLRQKAKTVLMASLSDVDAIEILLENFAQLLGWGDFEVTSDWSSSEPEEVPLQSWGIVAKTTRSVAVAGIEPGKTVTLTDEMHLDPQSAREIVDMVVARFANPEQAAAARRKLDESGELNMTMSARTVFDLATGLPLLHEGKRSGGPQAGSQILVRIEWLR